MLVGMRHLPAGERTLDRERLTEIAERLVRVDGVVGVCLGGSRARGTHRPDSDHDLGLYYRGPLDTAALRALAARLAGRDVEVTEPGGWGPWVDGGAWLTVGGAAVDWLYRDFDRVARIWQDCRAGRFEVGTQAGHPLGFHSYAYVGELALGQVLADPLGELAVLRERVQEYPDELRAAVLAGARWEVPFILAGARKGVARGDAFYVHGCLFRAVGLLAHAVHARAGRWVLNEKGAVAAAGLLPGAPARFTARAQALFGGADLSRSIDAAEQLASDVMEFGER